MPTVGDGTISGTLTADTGVSVNIYHVPSLEAATAAPVIGDTVVGAGATPVAWSITGLPNGVARDVWSQALVAAGGFSVASNFFPALVPTDVPAQPGTLDPIVPIQTAIYARLTGDATLTALITGVFDEVPDNQPFPYVTIGDFDSSEWRTHDRPGYEVVGSIHVWSKARGNKESLDIGNAIGRLLGDRTDIPLVGFTLVASWFQDSNIIKTRDADGVQGRNVIYDYRLRVQQD